MENMAHVIRALREHATDLRGNRKLDRGLLAVKLEGLALLLAVDLETALRELPRVDVTTLLRRES